MRVYALRILSSVGRGVLEPEGLSGFAKLHGRRQDTTFAHTCAELTSASWGKHEPWCLSPRLPCEWLAIRRGDPLPQGAIEAGQSKTDGRVFVARHKGGECGKLNLSDEDGAPTVWNIWTTHGGAAQEGEVLVVHGAPYEWVKVHRGSELPSGSLHAGTTEHGEIFVARDPHGVCGLLTLDDGRVRDISIHGRVAWHEGEVLVMHAGQLAPLDESGYRYLLTHREILQLQTFIVRLLHCMDREVENTESLVALAHHHRKASPSYTFTKLCRDLRDAPWTRGEAFRLLTSQSLDVKDDSEGTCFWDPEAVCDGISGEDRAIAFLKDAGETAKGAVEHVMSSYPASFRRWWIPDAECDGESAESRVCWFVANAGMSEDAARVRVRREFPSQFRGCFGWDFIDGIFPHTMSIVERPGGPRLRVAVEPSEPSEVSNLAVHYEVDGQSGETMMKFSVNDDARRTTHVHVTPDSASDPQCPSGAEVAYWVSAFVRGTFVDMPSGASTHPNRRLRWIAHRDLIGAGAVPC